MTPINTRLLEAKNRLQALEKIMRAATQEQFDALDPEFFAYFIRKKGKYMKNIEAIQRDIETASAIKLAVFYAGGQSELARKINALAGSRRITQPGVYYWIATNRVPADRVLQIEAVVGGLVTRHQLRPDIYPAAS